MPFISVFLKIVALAALLLIGYLSVSMYATQLTSWFKKTEQVQNTLYGAMKMPVEPGERFQSPYGDPGAADTVFTGRYRTLGSVSGACPT